MGNYDRYAEQIRKSTFGKEVREPICDALESASETIDALKNAAFGAIEDAYVDCQASINATLRQGERDIESALLNGRSNLYGAIDENKEKLRLIIQKADDPLMPVVQENKEQIREESDEITSSFNDFYDGLENHFTDFSEEADEDLSNVKSRHDSRFTAYQLSLIQDTESDYNIVFS